jgi:GMP synthase-like glutamine amidotransferase
MSTCLIIQHVEVEHPFKIAEALRIAQIKVQMAEVFAGDAIPSDASGLDGVVVMGGPMSARSDEGFESRRAEIALLCDAFEREVPVLGVCLGAQLLATACGGEVKAGEVGPEIGWGTVELTEVASTDALLGGLPEAIPVLHWHSETFELPPGALKLASSSRYPNQAFRVGERAWGFQFHLEIDDAAVRSFVVAFAGEATDAGCDPVSIQEATPSALEILAPHQDRVLARFTTVVASSGWPAGFGAASSALPNR